MGLWYVKLAQFGSKGMSGSPWHYFTLADGRQSPQGNLKKETKYNLLSSKHQTDPLNRRIWNATCLKLEWLMFS